MGGQLPIPQLLPPAVGRDQVAAVCLYKTARTTLTDPAHTRIRLFIVLRMSRLPVVMQPVKDLDESLDPFPHRAHYATPFNVGDYGDSGKYHPKTVSWRRSDISPPDCGDNLG